MRELLSLVLGMVACTGIGLTQTAEELINKNLEAKGGLTAIKAITSLRMTGKLQQGTFVLPTEEDAKAPDLLRQSVTMQGLVDIEAYDGTTAWRISPFMGRKDPELMGEDDRQDFVEQADFYGPLVDYQQKGTSVEYLGKFALEGDDTYRLKLVLKNGDIIYYYLDPDTYIEIRTEKQMFVRGAVHETVNDLGAYKKVAGVYFPFSVDSWPKNDPSQKQQVTYERIEANVQLTDALFRMPAAAAAPGPLIEKGPERPAQKKQEPKPPEPKPPQK